MNCEQLRQQIAEMSTTDAETLMNNQHLQECGSCREYYADISALSKGLSSLTINAPLDMLPAATYHTLGRRNRIVSLMAAALVLLLVGAVGAIYYDLYIQAPIQSGGSRLAPFDLSGPKFRKGANRPTAIPAPERSTTSPSDPSRN